MIKSCVLHFGLPKTASTSIQQFLRHDLEDRGFCYPLFSGGGVSVPDDCHNRALCCAFFSKPENYHTNAKLGLSMEVMRLQGAEFRTQLSELARSSPAHTLLLSAEHLGGFPHEDLRGLVDFLANLGLRVRAIAFVRKFKRHQESRFQQRVREPGPNYQSKPAAPGFLPFPYRRIFSDFDALLGPSEVQILEFDPGKFEAGCAVRQFCKAVGIRQDNILARAVNETLSREAIQLLYSFRKHGSGYGKGWEALDANRRLVERLSQCKGRQFLYHSSFLLAAEKDWREEMEWAEERTGIDLLGDLYADDDKDCIRGEADLFHFSKASLDWLARESGVSSRVLRSGDPESVARAVECLRDRLSCPDRPPGLWARLTARVRHRVF
jgi:hypothetical protein